MIPPVRVGICETKVEITHQRRSDFVELHIRNVAARTRVVAETELKPVRNSIDVSTATSVKKGHIRGSKTSPSALRQQCH